MQEWTEIRHRVLVEGASKRSVCRDYGIAHKTLQKILANTEPPGYRRSAPRPRTKLGPYLPVIEEILASDREAPPKQHHTAKRIFERLRDEYGYQGGITQVKEAVARHHRHAQEVFVPLSHPPGEAQFDFGYATVEIAGVRRKAAFAVMSLPYSDAFHVSAYPRECTETFQAAHVAAFGFFCGVPTRTAYDNTTIAVRKVIGRERALTREFLRLQSHFLFAHRFCRVGRGNEKGHVESLVGYGRRNFMVPVPSCSSFAELNARLEASCRADLVRQVRGKPVTKAELLEVDRAAMLPIPTASFEARRVVHARANSLSLVRFDRNDYSVPTAFAHHELTVVGGIEGVRIVCGTRLVATHPRCWEKEQTTFDPRHYLALLERKPGALDVARPLEDWDLPEADGMVIFASGSSGLVALDATTGTLVWSETAAVGAPIAQGTMAYHLCSGNTVFALSVVTRTVTWSFSLQNPSWDPTPPFCAIPALSAGKLYVSYSDRVPVAGGDDYSSVFELSASTGKQLWSYDLSSPSASTLTPPAVGGGEVFVGGAVGTGAEGGYEFALDASTGQLLWSSQVSTAFGLPSLATVDGGSVFVAFDGTLDALDVTTGSPRWEASGIGGGCGTAVVAANGVLYGGTCDGHLYAVDESNGNGLLYVDGGEGGPTSDLAVANGMLYIDFSTSDQFGATGHFAAFGLP